MTKEKGMRLHSIFNIILACFIILTGLCFMAGCIRIYFNVTFEGGLPVFHPDQAYSRELVADTFSKIAIPVYATLALVAVGFIYEFFSPIGVKRKKVNKDYENLAKRLGRKKNVAGGGHDKEIVSAIYIIKRKRTVLKWVLFGLWAVFSALYLAYAMVSKNYTDNINGSVLNAFLILLSCIAVPFGYSVYYIYATEKSFEKEVDLLKKLPDAREDELEAEPVKKENKALFMVRIAVIAAVAIGLIVGGIYLGGYSDVLTKAVNICTECIGLG